MYTPFITDRWSRVLRKGARYLNVRAFSYTPPHTSVSSFLTSTIHH